jgi:hypothetical protein
VSGVVGELGGQGGRKEEGADTALKTKTPQVNVGNKH